MFIKCYDQFGNTTIVNKKYLVSVKVGGKRENLFRTVQLELSMLNGETMYYNLLVSKEQYDSYRYLSDEIIAKFLEKECLN